MAGTAVADCKLNTKVIQVTNVAPGAIKEQMKTLFSFLGRIEEVRMYPSDLECIKFINSESDSQVSARVCYVKFEDPSSVGVALHLTNTVFIDRALIVVPVMDGKIPDETTALQLAPSAIAGMIPGQPTWPSNVVSQMTGQGNGQVITTYDPRLTALGLAQYPPLPGTTDPSKIEEIRRTVYVFNIDSSVTAEQLLAFFSQVGEVKYVRMAGEENMPTRCAFVEFTDQRAVATVLTYNNTMLGGRPIKVSHANSSIVKPVNKNQETAQRELEEAMKKVKEAQSLILAAVEPEITDKKRSRSRSKSKSHRRHSRSRSKSKPKRRTRTRSRSRSRPRPSPKRHSRSRSRRRSVSRGRRSRSRKRSPRRSRSHSRPRHHRTRSRSPVEVKTKMRNHNDEWHMQHFRTRHPRSRSRGRKSRSPHRKRSRSRTRRTPPKAYSARRSRTPPRSHEKRSRSRTPSKKSRRSHSFLLSYFRNRPNRNPRRRSTSPPRNRRSRSRSGSRHKSSRSKKKKEPRERSRERSREKEGKSKKKHKEHRSDKEEKSSIKTDSTRVTRDYDEEEKGYVSGEGKAEKVYTVANAPTVTEPTIIEGSPERESVVPSSIGDQLASDVNLQQMDMDMSD
ncbi:serine/arginine-rich splicing factor 11 isoform X5 [Octopus bimaculoides]|uniref:serine/arginine-rich splicing factor 11 isoform X5 n=1 Tax=Octopus bimaculoides TaxID=37653 RepID=UPI00071C2CD6|nr:serine/arginine-rich splicing factor 11 isoform X5 [Octopus bimaculoides]|eukprot:XP_014784128.1 PREDICTED: serine/arginine-rich splicing factor 11-like isoform X5 [Octopus bimaculoides]